MSLLYLKSEEFVQGADNNKIQIGSQLPYNFRNKFLDPIEVDENSKIELISADLNVSSQHKTTAGNLNNNYTYATGRNVDGFLQKCVDIRDATYTDAGLAAEMESRGQAINNVDGAEIGFQHDIDDKFEFVGDVSFDSSKWNSKNTYVHLNTKMGFNPSTAEQDAGQGSYNTTVQIVNEDTLTDPHTLLNSQNVQKLTELNLLNAVKNPNLICNLVSAKDHGIYNGCGAVCSIASPLKFVRFTPASFLTNAGSDKFEYKSNGSVQGGTNGLQAYTGSNGYDFQYQYGGSDILRMKMIVSQAELDTFSLPNGTTAKNMAYGHFLIANFTDIAISTTLANNNHVWMLNTETSDYFWDHFSTSSSLITTSTFRNDTDTTFIKSQAITTSLGNWGSSSLSLSRGETALLNSNTGLPNQVDTVNRFTRTRVVNDSGGSGVINTNEIYADYTIQISPSSDGTEQYVLMNYGTQGDGKVAGGTDWLTLTQQVPSDARKLSAVFTKRALTTADNLIMVASMTEWLCVKFFIGHDTGGNLVFDDLVEVGNTEDTEAPDSIKLPMNFNESSYPIIPVIGAQSPFLGESKHQQMIFGKYSQKDANTKNLSSLNAYMNTNFNDSLGIPVRQPKQTITDYCALQLAETLTIAIEPNGFNGKTTSGSVIIPNGKLAEITVIHVNPYYLLRFGGPISATKESDRGFYEMITDNGWNLTPNLATTLYLNLGFPKAIAFLDYEEPLVFSSINQPIHAKGQNFIVNLNGIGRLQGQNSSTGSISQMVGIIPEGELVSADGGFSTNDKHYKSPYPIQVNVNAKGRQNVNNFNVIISNDDGTPATSLQHPTNLFLRIT